MTIDLNAIPIEAEELEKIKVIANAPTLELVSKFFEKISPLTNITINEIMIAFNFKEGKYSKDIVNIALIYASLEDKAKENMKSTMTEEELIIFQEIAEDARNKITLLMESPLILFKAIISQGIVNNEPIGLFDEFLDILVCGTYPHLDKSRLFMSDFIIWIELFIRLFLKQQGAIGKSFFILKGVETLKTNIPILNFLKKESLNILKKL